MLLRSIHRASHLVHQLRHPPGRDAQRTRGSISASVCIRDRVHDAAQVVRQQVQLLQLLARRQHALGRLKVGDLAPKRWPLGVAVVKAIGHLDAELVAKGRSPRKAAPAPAAAVKRTQAIDDRAAGHRRGRCSRRPPQSHQGVLAAVVTVGAMHTQEVQRSTHSA
jgi:hypothetical protein